MWRRPMANPPKEPRGTWGRGALVVRVGRPPAFPATDLRSFRRFDRVSGLFDIRLGPLVGALGARENMTPRNYDHEGTFRCRVLPR